MAAGSFSGQYFFAYTDSACPQPKPMKGRSIIMCIAPSQAVTRLRQEKSSGLLMEAIRCAGRDSENRRCQNPSTATDRRITTKVSRGFINREISEPRENSEFRI